MLDRRQKGKPGRGRMRCAGARWGLAALLAFLPCAQPAGAEMAGGGEADLVLYHNLPEAPDPASGMPLTLHALRVYPDGHAEKTDGKRLSWVSSDPSVAEVDATGRVAFTGRPGRIVITAADGRHADRIALDVRRDSSASPDRAYDRPPVRVTVVKPAGERYRIVDKTVRGMTLEEKIGQLLMPDFRQWKGRDVTALLPEIAEAIRTCHVGGVILLRENLVDTGQAIRLIDGFQQAADKVGLLIGADQEGGIVTRLQQGTDMPGNMALGAAGSPELARQVGRAVGEELAALGINMNFAPVLDVNINPDNPVIGVRSFGEDPDRVAELGAAYVEGLQSAGVAATGKHFPGHGDTGVDSHVGRPVVPHDWKRLMQVEWRPFAKAIASGIDALMTAHVSLPKIERTTVISPADGSKITLPATLSKAVLTGVIRERLGFDGVVVTDAMNMRAVADHFGPVDAAVRAVQAGADIVLMPVQLEQVYNGLLQAARDGTIPQERVDASVRRILTLKAKRGIFVSEEPEDIAARVRAAAGVIGSAEHRRLEREIAARSVTLIKNDAALPLKREAKQVVAVVGAAYADALAAAVKALHADTVLIKADRRGLTFQQVRMLHRADVILIGSYTAEAAGWSLDYSLMKLYNRIIADAHRRGRRVIGIAIRNPYDIMAFPDADGYLAIYGFRPANFAAAADALFGLRPPTGRLPVSIPDGAGGILYELGHGLTYGDGPR